MLRILIALVSVYVPTVLAGVVAIWWRSRDPSVVSSSAMGQTTDPALQELLRSDAGSAGTNWWLMVIAASAIAAAVWLVLAQRRKPATPLHARSATAPWWLLLALALAAAFGAGYIVYVNAEVAYSWRLTLILAGMVALVLAYYLATSFGVKRSMIPSVPLASLFRR